MSGSSVLSSSKVVAFLPATDLARARDFYQVMLGLRLVSDERPVAMVYDGSGTMLRVTRVQQFHPHPFTVFGWQVDAIESTVQQLIADGIIFLRYAGLNENHPLGIWTAPGGARIAWFKDPDGNVLSLTQI